MNNNSDLSKLSDEEMSEMLAGIKSDRRELENRQIAFDQEMVKRNPYFYLEWMDNGKPQRSGPFETYEDAIKDSKGHPDRFSQLIQPHHPYNGS